MTSRLRSLASRLTDGKPQRARVVLATGGLSAATVVFNIVTTLALTHILGAVEYGAYAFALAAAGVLSIPAVLGLTPLVIRHVAGYRAKSAWGAVRGVIRRAHQAVLIASVSFACLGALAGFGLRVIRPSVVDAYWIGLALVPMVALASIRQATIQGFNRVVLARIPETLIQPLVFLSLLAVAAEVAHVSGADAVAINVAAGGVAFVVGLIMLRQVLPDHVRRAEPVYDTRVWARSAVPLLVLNGIQLFNDQIDVILLGTLKGAGAAGIFSVADRASGMVSFWLLASAYPLAPALAHLAATANWAEFQRLLTRVTRLVFLGAAVVAVPMVVLGPRLLRLFGPGFNKGYPALVILCVGQLVNCLTGHVGLALMMAGYEVDVTKAIGVGAVVSIGLNVALIPHFGIAGAATGTAVGVVLSNLMLMWQLWRRAGMWSGAFGRPGRPSAQPGPTAGS